ncbi:MAG: high-potential iron-sulfur protein [Halieaceae bacterium]|nr:high-potential iron-sulfur protein [Halieaceae bacterium]
MKRRTLVTAVPILTAFALGMLGRRSTAQEQQLKPLDQSNPAAKALHYVDNVADADPGIYDDARAGELCRNCAHFRASDGARGSCGLFPGYSVAAQGWCSGWAKKV